MSATPDRCERQRLAALRRTRPRTKVQREAWAARLRQKYGLTPDDVALKWAEQEGRCPICGGDLMEKTWVIDHDHKTGRFRGILDTWCNHRIVSMAERGGFDRAHNVLHYLWTDRILTLIGDC